MKIFKKMKKGFTLVELVVVIAVIAILAAVSVGAYFGITDSANASKLEQEAKQVHTAIQTVALAPNEHSSLNSDGLTVTDPIEFEKELEKNLGRNVYLTSTDNEKDNDLPTIYFSTNSYNGLVGANTVYSSFQFHLPEISNKKAIGDVVTGAVKSETASVTVVEGEVKVDESGETSAPTVDPTIDPTVDSTISPTVDPTVDATTESTAEPSPSNNVYTKVMHDLVDWTGKYVIASHNDVFDSTTTATEGNAISEKSLYVLDTENNTIEIDDIYTFEIESSNEADKYYVKKSDGKYLSFSGSQSSIKYTEKDEAKTVTITVSDGTADVALSDNPSFMLKCKDNNKFKFYNGNNPKVSLYKLSSEISYVPAEYTDMEVSSALIFNSPTAEMQKINVRPIISNGDDSQLEECSISFISNDPSIVTVNGDGEVTPVGSGSTKVAVNLLVGEEVIINKLVDVTVYAAATSESKIFTFSNYPDGTQYAQGEEHTLDENFTLVINGAHLNGEIRLYAGSNAVIYGEKLMTAITLNAGNKAGTLIVSVCDDGSTWTKVGEVTTSTSYTDYAFTLGGHKYVKFESVGAQIRVKKATITFNA